MKTRLTKKEKEQKRKLLEKRLMWRWSLFTAILAAIIIGIIALCNGSLDVGRESGIFFLLNKRPTFQLPYSISHWEDVLSGPILSIVTIFACFSIKSNANGNPEAYRDWVKTISLILFWIGFAAPILNGHGLASSLFGGTIVGLLTIVVMIILYYLCIWIIYPFCDWLFEWLSGDHNLQ